MNVLDVDETRRGFPVRGVSDRSSLAHSTAGKNHRRAQLPDFRCAAVFRTEPGKGAHSNRDAARRTSLTLIPAGPIQINADSSAAVPAKVEFKNVNKQMSAQSTAEFVKRNQVWYFANFSFVAFPTVIIAVIVVGALAGISNASGVLLLRRRLLRQGKLDWSNRAKIFALALFGPNLFSKSS